MTVGDQVRVIRPSMLHAEGKVEYRGVIVRMPLMEPHRRLDDAAIFVMIQGEKRAWPIDPAQISPLNP